MKGISGYGAKDAPNSTYRTSPKLLSGALLSLDGGERFGDESDGDPGFDCRGAGDIGHQRLAVLLEKKSKGKVLERRLAKLQGSPVAKPVVTREVPAEKKV